MNPVTPAIGYTTSILSLPAPSLRATFLPSSLNLTSFLTSSSLLFFLIFPASLTPPTPRPHPRPATRHTSVRPCSLQGSLVLVSFTILITGTLITSKNRAC
ncbi:hypothetical protein F5Y12DRAFT_353006 [Xylaria sp. FL1777]|nr:hypothetical protein F5Y12DRAFT_353006 [Xylaria sp. FL1777]